MKRWLFWAAGLLSAGLVLAVVGCAALSYGWQREWLREQLAARLTDSLGTPVVIQALDGVLHREFELQGIRVGGAEAPLANASSVQLTLGSLGLSLPPTLTLDALKLTGIRVALRSQEGRWPWQGTDEGAPAETNEGSGWPLRIRLGSVVLDDARVALTRGPEQAISIDLAGQAAGIALGAEPLLEQAEVSFRTAGPAGAEGPQLQGRMRAAYKAAGWRLEELSVEGPLLTLSAHGSGDALEIEDLQVALAVPRLHALADHLLVQEFPVDGGVDLNAALQGPYGWPQGRMTLDATALASAGLNLGDVHLEARSFDQGRLRIEALRLEKGVLDARGGSPGEIVATPENTTLNALQLQSPDGLGTLQLDATLPRAAVGELARHPETRLEMHSVAWPLATLQPLWSQLELELAGHLSSDLSISGAPDGALLQGALKLSAGRVASETARAEGIDLGITLAGSIAAPSVEVDADIKRLALGEEELGALDIRAKLQGKQVVIQRLALRDGPIALRVAPAAKLHLEQDGIRFEAFALEAEGQRITLSGGLSADEAKAFRLELAQLDMDRIARVLQTFGLVGEDTGLSGYLNGQLSWDGPRMNPSLEGDLLWSDAQLGQFGFEQVELHAETQGPAILLSTRWQRQGVNALSLSTSLPRDRVLVAPNTLVADPRAQVEAQTDAFELGTLAAFLADSVSELSGVLTGRVEARGGTPSPSVSGHAVVDAGSVGLTALPGSRLSPIHAELDFAGERLMLKSLRIGVAGAELRGSGEAQLAATELRAVEVSLAFDAFPVDAPGIVRGTVTGPLTLAGSTAALELSGDLELADLELEIPGPKDTALKEIRVVVSDRAGPAVSIREESAESMLDPMRVDLRVTLQRNSWARGRGAEVELRGELHAEKGRGEPLGLSGTIETVRGTYEIYGRRFRIERGEAILDGAAEVDPILNVRALHRVRGVRIYALIEGRLSEPQLRFESEPAQSEMDIASYLLFGRPASGDGQAALDGVAARVAAGAALREFEQTFGGTLPVDLVDVRMESDGDSDELRAGVGKYVGEQLFLYYERGFGDESEEELRAEYQLTPRWSVQSSVTTEGETAGDVVFEIEY